MTPHDIWPEDAGKHEQSVHEPRFDESRPSDEKNAPLSEVRGDVAPGSGSRLPEGGPSRRNGFATAQLVYPAAVIALFLFLIMLAAV